MQNNDEMVCALVLAAGFGERIKTLGPKPLLKYKGKAFVAVIIEKIKQAGIESIFVITNDDLYESIKNLKLPVKLIRNPNPEKGMLSSVKLGVEKAQEQCPGILMCPVDYPLVKPETYQLLITQFKLNPTKIIKPAFNDLSGHPIVLPKFLFTPIRNTPMEKGVRHVTRQYSHRTLFVPVNDSGILHNINTPEKYLQHCR